MARLIVFLFCIAYLAMAGVSVRVGMFVTAFAVAVLAVYVVWCGVQLFMGHRR